MHDGAAELDEDMLARGQLIARQLAGSSEYGVFAKNRTFLNGLAKAAVTQPEVRSVVILSETEELLAAAGQTSLSMLDEEATRGGIARMLGRIDRQSGRYDNGETVLLYQPIETTQIPLDDVESAPEKRQAGAVIVEMSWEHTRQHKSARLRFTILTTAAMLLVMLYLVRLAGRQITQPISEMSRAIHAIGEGRLETRVASSSRIEELDTLIEGFNRMSGDLAHERAELQQRIDDATQQLRTLAFYDPLTKLPNRRLFGDRLTQAMVAGKRLDLCGALMFLDLDKFKQLNDEYGHAVGDQFLVEAAHRIRSCLRDSDTVARFGGDEFVVMLNGLGCDHEQAAAQAGRVAEKIRASLAEPYHLVYQPSGQPDVRVEHHASASIGVMMFRGQEDSEEDVLRAADAAMYRAKQGGCNRVCFHEPGKEAECDEPR